MARAPSTPIHYQVAVHDLHAHLFAVTLTIARPQALQVVRLPVWIPGSYLVREFAKHLQQLQARQGSKACAVEQLDKAGWAIACEAGKPLVLHYQVYANDASVRTAWLDAQRGFFNGTSLCLGVQGQLDQPHGLELVASKSIAHWSVATGARPHKVNKQGFGSYTAPNYDALVDCPVEMGPFWSGSFSACGVPHRFVVAGAPPGFDGERLLADTQAICETEIRFWHGTIKNDSKKPSKLGGRSPVPYENYVFMLNAVADGYGGLEHANSTALIAKRADLPRRADCTLGAKPGKPTDGYTQLLGLISHEYFHTWNVKRLRPIELARYDYTQENYTELLWFFEGFTSYYDDLLLRRAGLIDNATYLKLLGKTLNQVAQTPGRKVQTVAQASFDAWVKYYRQDENTPNATVSYYTKGSLVALCLDLTLRKEGRTTLDAVMRGLWQRCQGGPMRESDLLAVLAEQGARSFAEEIKAWVHSTAELPVEPLLQAHGVTVAHEPDALAQRLGLRVKEGSPVQIAHVLRGGAAEAAGFASGDEWLGVAPLARKGAPQAPVQGWRLHSLDDLVLYAGPARTVQALVARDRRLLTLQLELPAAGQTVQLSCGDATALDRWLAAPA